MEARVRDPDERLDLGRSAGVGLREERQRECVHGVEPARRVAERPAEHEPHRPAEHGRAEPPRRAREVAVGRIALARDEARPDRDVALTAANHCEEPRKLARRVLAVGIDAAAVRIAVLERVPVPGGDPEAQPEVGAQRVHLGAVLARDVGGVVGRAVVDDEHVGVRQLGVERVENRRKVVLLVPGGDEDQRVAQRCSLT